MKWVVRVLREEMGVDLRRVRFKGKGYVLLRGLEGYEEVKRKGRELKGKLGWGKTGEGKEDKKKMNRGSGEVDLA